MPTFAEASVDKPYAPTIEFDEGKTGMRPSDFALHHALS